MYREKTKKEEGGEYIPGEGKEKGSFTKSTSKLFGGKTTNNKNEN